MHHRSKQKKNEEQMVPLVDFVLREASTVASSFVVMGYVGGSHEKYFLACHRNEAEGQALFELADLVAAWQNPSNQETGDNEKDTTNPDNLNFDRK